MVTWNELKAMQVEPLRDYDDLKRKQMLGGCSSKARHESKSKANIAKQKLIKKYPHKQVRVYKCKQCNGFHITHLEGR